MDRLILISALIVSLGLLRYALKEPYQRLKLYLDIKLGKVLGLAARLQRFLFEVKIKEEDF